MEPMERSLETTSFSPIQEISLISKKPNFRYLFHNSQPLVPILRQFNPVYVTTNYFLKNHLNTIPAFTFTPAKWSFPSSHPTKTLDAQIILFI
jgi:hypothetical protein